MDGRTTVARKRGGNALEFLEAARRRHPEKVAVIDEHGSVTYAELHRRAQAIGSALIGDGFSGVPVAVCAEKGVDALAACLGVLYAGGCYTPIDPIAVPSRLASVVRTLGEGAGPVPIIADAPTRDAVSASLASRGADRDAATVLALEDLIVADVEEAALERAASEALSTEPAYILFTSGSTGTPKGVAVSHRSIVEFIDSFVELFGIDETDIIGNQAPFDFDVSVKDIYGSLAAGATLVILPRRLFSEPAALVDALKRHRVTTLTWAVAALCLLTSLHALDYTDLPCVRRVLFSGEAMPLRHLRQWLSHLPQARFYNLYGPTEVTCNCTWHEIDRGRDYVSGIPLGDAFPDHEIMLLDEAGRPVGRAGGIGEIYVRSPQLALGYIGDTERTREAFVPNPLRTRLPETVYRTGDLAQVNERGELVFCGRRDNQIKHLGHRIELEEIDLAIERIEGVARCRCAYDERRHRIFAFYEGSGSPDATAAEAQRRLPAHLMPSALIPVPEMPLSKNGKVDRCELLKRHAPARPRRGGRVAAATTPCSEKTH